MCFWSILLCLTLVLNNGIMETPKFVFDYIPMNHSNVLITWKSNTSLNEDYSDRVFTFSSRRATRLGVGGFATFELEDGNYSIDGANISTGQIMINDLYENMLYKVIIQQYLNEPGSNSQKLETRFPPLMIKANRRSNTSTKPAKPDLQYEFSTSRFLNDNYLRILWIPCGTERNCHGNEAGTHFAVKFRPLDRRGDYRFDEEGRFDYINFACLIGGIQYEVMVISINGDYETESDPQQIFVPPLSSAVTSVKVVSLLNGSVSVSWKPPKYAIETLSEYLVGIINDSTVNNPAPLYKDLFLYSDIKESVNGFHGTLETEKVFDKKKFRLKPGDTYTFFILPMGEHLAGLETRVKYTIPRNNDEL